MAERAAHLVDHVFPEVAVRQWVLSLPPRIRYVLAWDHALCRAVVGVFMRAVRGVLRRRARERQGVANGRGGAVAIIQRFGAALNLNVHVHALVLDGVYGEDGTGGLCFHPVTPPTDDEMDELLAAVARRIDRLLARRGVVDGGEHGPDRWSEEAFRSWRGSRMPPCRGAPRSGRAPAPRCGDAEAHESCSRCLRSVRGPCHARLNGFDLHAAVVVPGAIGRGWSASTATRSGRRWPHERIRLTEQGQVLLELRHRRADGTTHVLFDPVELLERLAALTPRPRINLVLYHVVLGARSAWRSRLGPPDPWRLRETGGDSVPRPEAAARPSPGGRSNLQWAQLVQRSFRFDVLACPRCGGRLRLVALIEEARVIRRILGHLGLPTEAPAARPSRAPPMPFDLVAAADDIAIP